MGQFSIAMRMPVKSLPLIHDLEQAFITDMTSIPNVVNSHHNRDGDSIDLRFISVRLSPICWNFLAASITKHLDHCRFLLYNKKPAQSYGPVPQVGNKE
jgi:hypothetical protein